MLALGGSFVECFAAVVNIAIGVAAEDQLATPLIALLQRPLYHVQKLERGGHVHAFRRSAYLVCFYSHRHTYTKLQLGFLKGYAE